MLLGAQFFARSGGLLCASNVRNLPIRMEYEKSDRYVLNTLAVKIIFTDLYDFWTKSVGVISNLANLAAKECVCKVSHDQGKRLQTDT